MCYGKGWTSTLLTLLPCVKEESLCTASPFNVRAVKDSEELELSLDLNNAAVRCDKIKVKVPVQLNKFLSSHCMYRSRSFSLYR